MQALREALEGLTPDTMPPDFVPLLLLTACVVFALNQACMLLGGFSSGASSRIVSQINAMLLTGLVAVHFLPFCGGVFPYPTAEVVQDMGMWPPKEQAWLSTWTIPSITAGFFVGDFFMCLLYEDIRDFSTFVHHIAGIAAVSVTAVTGFGVVVQSFAACNELSTIFLNPHWCISYYLEHPEEASPALRPHLRTLRTLNGTFFWATFTLSRIIGNAYVTWLLWHASVGSWHITQVGPIASALGLAALHCLNAVWWFQLTKGLIKALFGGKSKAKKQ